VALRIDARAGAHTTSYGATPVSAIVTVPPGVLETISFPAFVPAEVGENLTAITHVPLPASVVQPLVTMNSVDSVTTAVIEPLSEKPPFEIWTVDTGELLDTATLPKSII
jgi:hypothetical protein